MKAKKLIEALVEAIERLLAGAPAPEPIPVRVKERRPPRQLR